jgi:RNA polymerase sigma-70 factor (ECF subfamily)
MAMGSQADMRSRFETIWNEHRLQVLAYCLRRISGADAEDACAETFLVVWRRLDEVPPPPKTLLWIFGIARHVLSNQNRAFYRRGRLRERLTNLGVSPSSDPVDFVVQSTEGRRVAEAVNRLKPTDREIVRLDAWEDLTREEISEVMGMTRAAVDQRIHRAYERLSRALAPTISPIHSPPVAKKGGT